MHWHFLITNPLKATTKLRIGLSKSVAQINQKRLYK